MNAWRLVVTWAGALIATTLITWQIVAMADTQVSDRPADLAVTVTTEASGEASTTTSSSPTTSTSISGASTTTPVASTTSTTSPSPGSSTSTSTTSPGSTSTTNPASAKWQIRSIVSSGGVVVVRHRPGEVLLEAATPLLGYATEIDDAGPDRVRVEFENASGVIRVEAEPGDAGLDIRISSHG